MKVNVTQAIIDEAVTRNEQRAPGYDSVRECMVGLALKAATGQVWKVGFSCAADSNWRYVNGVKVEPFSFDFAAPQTVTA